MNPILLSTYDFIGGAGRACYRLHKSLQQKGLDSIMVVQKKITDDLSVIPSNRDIFSKVREKIDSLPLLMHRHRLGAPFNVQWLPNPTLKSYMNDMIYDIIHIHWICNGFMPIQYLSIIRKPIIWTVHDSWLFTGGCHVPFECKGYEKSCGKCPQLGSSKNLDLSRLNWKRKRNRWAKSNFVIVAPSNWMADCIQRSSLFSDSRIEVIPNGLDIDKFKPISKKISRDILGLPQNKKLILFGSINPTSDKNKGFEYIISIAKSFNEKTDFLFLIFGSSNQEDSGLIPNIKYLGRINDDQSLALVYSAADVMVVPSQQENLPYAIMESISCGTPCVAFNVGGIPDLIDHKVSGYLAKPFEVKDLINGIEYLLGTSEYSNISKICRTKVENNFNTLRIAERYIDLYQDVLKVNH